MLSNLSNKIAATFGRSLKSPAKSPSSTNPVSAPLAEWPNDVTVAGEPLFTRPLTSADLDALQEAAGLGPPNWWLDADLARSEPEASEAGLSYEAEVALTAFLRAPFEAAGPIRSAASGLLDRLNELERLQALAMEESRRRAQGREKKVRHHSTLRLGDAEEDESVEKTTSGKLKQYRRDTYAVHLREPALSSQIKPPSIPKPETNNPRFCKSPERRETNRSEVHGLQRTYSKDSLDRLHAPCPLQRSLSPNQARSDMSGNSTQLLGRTYDPEELSDVFPSPRASLEKLRHGGYPPPPPTPSSELPQGIMRHHTFIRQPAQQRNLDREETLVPRTSASPMRSTRAPSAVTESQLRDSLPTRLNASNSIHHKLSAPDAPGLKTSGSGSNILPTSMSDAMALVREQEMKLRASSGRVADVNTSLTSSIEGSGGPGESTNRLNKSLPGEDGGLSRMFEPRGVRDVPQRYDPEGRRNVGGELVRNKSSSQSSLKDMASLTEMVKAQAESLRASGEQVMQKARSRSSLNQSIGASSTGSREASPHISQVAADEPLHHRSIERPTQLRDSGATFDLNNNIRESVNSSLQSGDLAPPRRSTSPVKMRRPLRGGSSNIPPPLTLPIDTDVISPETPQTAKTVRPGSYIDQLQSAKHASSAVEAWVEDTKTMNADNLDVNVAASGESFSGLRVSTDTYPLPDQPEGCPRPPEILRAPSPKLVEPPQSLVDNVMTTSQRTVTGKTPTTPTSSRPTTTVPRRGIAPAAVGGGSRGGVASRALRGGSAIRPPITQRSRPPTGSGIPVPTLASRVAPSQIRPPTRIRPPTSVPRNRSMRGTRGPGVSGSSRSTSRSGFNNPPPPEY